jgi:hypothetical protein
MCVSVKLCIIVVFLIQHCLVYSIKPKALSLQKVVTMKMICMYIIMFIVVWNWCFFTTSSHLDLDVSCFLSTTVSPYATALYSASVLHWSNLRPHSSESVWFEASICCVMHEVFLEWSSTSVSKHGSERTEKKGGGILFLEREVRAGQAMLISPAHRSCDTAPSSWLLVSSSM